MGESIQGIQRMQLSVRSERMNNLVYLLATVLLILGFSAQFSSQQFCGLILVTVGFLCISILNTSGFILGITGTKIELDFFVGTVQIVGVLLSFCSIFSIAILQAKIAAVIWLGIAGSSLMFIGALLNVIHSFEKQHSEGVEAKDPLIVK